MILAALCSIFNIVNIVDISYLFNIILPGGKSIQATTTQVGFSETRQKSHL